jgi:hypothetical protein
MMGFSGRESRRAKQVRRLREPGLFSILPAASVSLSRRDRVNAQRKLECGFDSRWNSQRVEPELDGDQVSIRANQTNESKPHSCMSCKYLDGNTFGVLWTAGADDE